MQFFVECPKCKLQNPPEAKRCQCGFVFALGRDPAQAATPNRRGAIWFGAALSLIGLLFFGFAFGWPVWQARHHQPGTIFIHPMFLAMASLFLTLGFTCVALVVFKFSEPKPGRDLIWKLVFFAVFFLLWVGPWIGLVEILRGLGYPVR
jgi:hypothetical protein